MSEFVFPLRSPEIVIGEIEQLKFQGIETPYGAMHFLSLSMERARNALMRTGDISERHVKDVRDGLDRGLGVGDVSVELATESTPRRTLLLSLFAPVYLDIARGCAPKDIVHRQQFMYERAFDALDAVNQQTDNPNYKVEGLQAELLIMAAETTATNKFMQLAIPATVEEDNSEAQDQLNRDFGIDQPGNSWDITVARFDFTRSSTYPNRSKFAVQPEVYRIDAKRTRVGQVGRATQRRNGVNKLTGDNIVSYPGSSTTQRDFMGNSDRAVSLRHESRLQSEPRLVASTIRF